MDPVPGPPRKTPEPLPVTDHNEGPDTSSPLKHLKLPVAGHNAEELARRTIPGATQKISEEKMWKSLGVTESDMNELYLSLPTMETAVKNIKSNSEYEQYAVYLNEISKTVHKRLGKGPEEFIRFFDSHNNAPEGHPTGTTSRPDFLALKSCPDGATPRFHWSAVEATGKLLSGKDKEFARDKTVAYTSYLLQARPDKLEVQGIYVDCNSFILTVSNACGAFTTGLLDWKSRPSRLLLCAWISRLYRPVADPSITSKIEQGGPPTFTITLPEEGGVYQDCTIHSTGSAFGRRTIILDCPGQPGVIIKEQYIETPRRFQEGPILDKIHKDGIFPGVVRQRWHGPVTLENKKLVVQWKNPETHKIYERMKTRIVLLDKGISLMDVKTPREALVALYDLLEITRFLYKKRKILHRDISVNNVLLRDAVSADTSSIDNLPLPDAAPANTSSGSPPKGVTVAEDLQEMCFASYLLKAKSNDPNVGRLDTRVLLIDFDMGEDEEQEDNGKGPHSRTGTPIFMARAVISGMQKAGDYSLAPMPQLGQESEAYKAAVPERLTAFPPNKKEMSEISHNKPLDPFKHKLKYDAESVYWLLLWWAIHALPVDDTPPGYTEIRQAYWASLTCGEGQDDPRVFFVYTSPANFVHPAYGELETLLEQMALQLRGYHEEGEDPSRKHDEYLHEVLQRLIFKFLFTHYDRPFMTAEKSPESRQPVEGSLMKGRRSANQINKARARASTASGPVGSSSSRSLRPSSGSTRQRYDANGPDEDNNDPDYEPRPTKRVHK